MVKRLELHQELLQFLPNVYFQPPSDLRMTYPCIVYTRSSRQTEYANDHIYKEAQEYQLTVIEYDPDSDLAKRIRASFKYCALGQFFILDGLNQTTLKLYY